MNGAYLTRWAYTIKDAYTVKCAYVTRMLIRYKVATWCMCLYDERYAATGIHGFICIFESAWVFLDKFREVTRVPWTYLS